ncbi:MAG: cysteine hydrolase family protein [Pseudonocardiaceae bacterium]
MSADDTQMVTWPDGFDAHIAPELNRSALLVIDTQVDFVDGGTSAVCGTTQVLPIIAQLLTTYRMSRRPIVHVVRLYDGDDVDLPRRALIAAGAYIVRPGSAGSQIVPELRRHGVSALDPKLLLAGELQELAPDEWAMWKPRWGAFHRTPLDGHLHALAVTTVVITGCNYPNCPRATVYGASEHDYRVLIVSDAISGVRPPHLDEAGLMGVLATPSSKVIDHFDGTARLT